MSWYGAILVALAITLVIYFVAILVSAYLRDKQ